MLHRLHRADGLLDLEIVKKTKIVIVGVGSLGSFIASLLVYPWREMVLIDPETLGEENIERHFLGRSWIGRTKAEGVASELQGWSNTRITACVDSVPNSLDQHKDANILILATGDDDVSASVNQWNSYGIPMLIGGVHAKGSGGEIILLPNPDVICFNCVEAELGQEEKETDGGSYGFEDQPVATAIPALRFAVVQVAAMCAEYALQMIQEESNPRFIQWFRDWRHFATVRGGGARSYDGWVRTQKLLAVPVRIEKGGEKGRFDFYAKGIRFERGVKRSEGCPFH